MHERYLNRKLYFEEQVFTTKKHVIPYINKVFSINKDTEILEIGCGEGGNLKAFLDMQCRCVGIDINEQQIKNAKVFYNDHPHKDKIEFIHSNIYHIDRENLVFDIIIMRDVIEHIHQQELFMQYVKKFLKPEGIIFFGFPPWQNPFGGHQQICQSKLSKIPYIHLLPTPFYRKLLLYFGENPVDLLEIKETGLSIERFHRILRKEKYTILKNDYYFINPNYEIKFQLRPKKVVFPFKWIPYLRNFYTTAYYLIAKPY